MASGKGHNGGFNPFRDAHGRFAPKGSGTAGSMNAAIRAAAGRGTDTTGTHTDDDAIRPHGVGRRVGQILTPAVLKQIDATPPPDGSKLSAAMRQTLDEAVNSMPYGSKQGIEGVFAGYGESLNSVTFELISSQGGTIKSEHAKALIQAYKEHGFDPPDNPKQKDLLDAMDSVDSVKWHTPAYESRISYGIAMALKAGDPGTALTLADGPEDAGIGWDLTRQELGAPPRD